MEMIRERNEKTVFGSSRTWRALVFLASGALSSLVGGACGGGETKGRHPRGAVSREGATEGDVVDKGKLRADSAPPLARRDNVIETRFGVKVHDPYRWMEKANHPDTKEWLTKMDTYTRRFLKRLPNREAIRERLEVLNYVDWRSAPKRRGKRFFHQARKGRQDKAVYYWSASRDGEAQVLLDPNTMSRDGSVCVKGVWPDYQGEKAVYKVSQNNADEAVLELMEVATKKKSTVDRLVGAKYAYPSWTPGGEGFFYTRLPMDPKISVAERPGFQEVYFHRVGTPQARDVRVYAKTGDPKTFLQPQLSRDGRYLLIYVFRGWSRTDVYLKKLSPRDRKWIKRGGGPPPSAQKGKKGKGWRGFAPLRVGQDATYECYAWRGHIYVLTNEKAPNGRMFKVLPHKPARNHWVEIIKERKDAVLRHFAVVGGHLSLSYLQKASSLIRVVTLAGEKVRDVKFPGLGSAVGLVGHPEGDVAYFGYESYTRPLTIYKTSVKRGGTRVYDAAKVPFESSSYTTRQVFYPSKDGTRVSMFVVHRKGLKRDGTTPFLLYGYGGFNISLVPRFRAFYAAWLERGGGLAVPNLRGGGEYGERWHRAGMLKKKQNTFDDFIAAAEFLVREGYTSSKHLAVRGGSNGGLLVGAFLTQRPKLARAAACHVPLLDMVRFHLFGSGKTWVTEYGSPENEEQFKVLFGYSPYHRVRKGAVYPSVLLLSADADDRVDPVHARKFAAALRWATSSGEPVLLRVETKAGHGGGDMLCKRIRRSVDEMSFLLNELGSETRRRERN